jgi:AcrR family transcriptional regulator
MPKAAAAKRAHLTRAKVFEAALRLADKNGVEALTMRELARKLGVEAMSLYHHVPDKDAILDGMVDLVFAEIELPDAPDWRTAMQRRALSLRQALMRHPWSVALLDSRRSPGAATLGHQDWVLGTLYRGGFSVPLAAHAIATIDAFVFGFAVQEVSLPFDTAEELDDVVGSLVEQVPADLYPNLMVMIRDHVTKPGYSFSNEFAFGLDLVLDGLDRARKAERRARSL